jgi:mRNA interferase MazF
MSLSLMDSVMFERGGVYLANLNSNKGNEPGKTRPVIIFQANALNEVDHPTIIVLPLTTQLIDQAYPLRFRLLAKDNLEKDSDVLCDQLRAISLHRLQPTKLRQLTSAQLIAIEQQVSHILDFSHV